MATFERADRLRTIEPYEAGTSIDFSNNDYLALAADPRVVAAMRRCERVGSGGARLLGGRRREHAQLEDALAPFLGRERVLLFSSGYLAAAGAIGVLAQCASSIYSDEFNHASIIDAARASRLERTVYPHRMLPPGTQRRSGALIVTESIFSMEGDAADLAGMVGDLGDDDMLLVDEAHAIGVAGTCGGGMAAAFSDPRVIVMGTLSKALGSQGGFVAGPARLIDLLVTSARPFIFDTALAPPLAAAAHRALDIVIQDEVRRAQLHTNVQRMRAGLRTDDVAAHTHQSPIVPVLLGEERRALNVARALRAGGIIAPAIRPPTVPIGTSRLRVSIRSDHTPEEIDALLEGLRCTVTL